MLEIDQGADVVALGLANADLGYRRMGKTGRHRWILSLLSEGEALAISVLERPACSSISKSVCPTGCSCRTFR
jgi:hypothetical protein